MKLFITNSQCIALFIYTILLFFIVYLCYYINTMIYSRKELSKRYYSTYQINKALEEKKLYKVCNGIYSDTKSFNSLLAISKKYPNFIFTMNSAYYYWNLTDVIPTKYFLATKQTSIRINNKEIKQNFEKDELFGLGKTTKKEGNININIYDKEKLLIELVRKKEQLPFDYYKEIINNYRSIVNELDIKKIMKYLSHYKSKSKLFKMIQCEVY